MAEQLFAEKAPVEFNEIQEYVVRPALPRDYRYQALHMRSSLRELRDRHRKSLADQLMSAWKSRPKVQVRDIYPVTESHEPGVAIRYEATVRSRYAPAGLRIANPKRLGLAGAALLGLALLTGGLAALTPSRPAEAPVAVAPVVEKDVEPKPAKPEPKKPAIPGMRTENLTYTVVAGDTFTSVGTKFGITPRTVRLVNELPLGYRLRPGQKLVITPRSGAYHKIQKGETIAILAKRYGITEDQVLRANDGIKPAGLQLGQKVFVPGARELRYAGYANVPPRGYRGGAFAKRISVSRSLVGQFGSRVGALMWPTHGDFSSPFGARGHAFHPGMDICGPIGTPIRAAKAGTILHAGWMGAYGYAVDIDHGGGVVTRYGHCSRVLVRAGQTVNAGDQIARMGSTGRSTGPHLHFEVRIQGRAVNPASFL